MSNIEKEIIINSSTNETRVALVEDQKLVEMFIERPENERTIGNIYSGRIENIVPGINSVFVDMGEKSNGFSHLIDFKNEVIPDDVLNGKFEFKGMDSEIVTIPQSKDSSRRINKKDKVMIQVIKEAIGIKGPRITSKVTIPGRFVVLIPNDRGVKISKKIRNISERKRLKKIVRNLIPDDFAVIVRTAAEKEESSSFSQDIIRTYNIWKRVIKEFKKSDKPTLLYKDYDMAASIVRDLFKEDVSKVRIDSKELYDAVVSYVNNVSPDLIDRIEYYSEGAPIFDHYYNINKDYYISLSREVFMKKGGSIVLDHTEALVAVDVNSKRYVKKRSHEDNSFAVNMAAAREVARQLRLRDLGGIVVIDFIDMLDAENRTKVFNELKNGLKRDGAKTSVEPISKFGLIEMTRQRLKPSIVQTVFDSCPTCSGKGIIKSKESVSIQIGRWIKNYKFQTKKSEVNMKLNSELHNFLTSGERNRILELQIKNWMKINIQIDNNLSLNFFKFYSTDTTDDITKEFMN